MIQTLNKQYIATFFLILMSIQYVPIEGEEASMIKFGAMCLAPFIWLIATPKVSEPLLWGGLYFLTVLFSGLFHPETFRFATVGYLLSFIFMFSMYYNLVWHENVFSIDYFIKLLKRLIIAYAIVLILQQVARLIGLDSLPLINLMKGDTRSMLIGNSLSIEQSHSARILAVSFLALLRMYEVKWGEKNVTIKAIYDDAKWVVLGFLWSMLMMGSGTAFVGLAILLLYFVKRQYIFFASIFIVILYFAIPYIDYKPLQRVYNIVNISMTMDADAVYKEDMSASARILPYLYTIEHFDITSSKTWFGEGVDTGYTNDKWGLKRMIGGMTDYGFLSYVFALLLVFRCCIRKFLSLETLFFVILLMAEIRSVYVWWSAFMMYTTIWYFQEQKKTLDDNTYQ